MPQREPPPSKNPSPAKEGDRGSPHAIQPGREGTGLPGGQPSSPKEREPRADDPARGGAATPADPQGSSDWRDLP